MPAITYQEYYQKALYGPQGYYRRTQERVGMSAQTDFYTSSSVPVFAKVLEAALASIRDECGLDNDTSLVEIGNERGRPVFGTVPQGWGECANYPLDSVIKVEGPAVVFSNELFDAQPMTRAKKTAEGWVELGLDVAARQYNIEMDKLAPQYAQMLPEDMPEGHIIDFDKNIFEFVKKICGQRWYGAFVVLDYGMTLTELAERPQGTARAYHNHQQISIAQVIEKQLTIGSYDLTYHIVWDHMREALERQGFVGSTLQSQEAFIVKRAGSQVFAHLAPQERQQLTTLIHPAYLGQKFQVMVAKRAQRDLQG